MTEFTPIASLVGGLLIGLSSVLLLAFNGRIAGISGIVGGLLASPVAERGWRATFVVGLVVGGVAMYAWTPAKFGTSPTSLPWLVVGGLAVGIGTRLGGGCTSGHGVCGMSRLSPRSMVATVVFMAVAALTVFVMLHVAS